jgi:aspartate-semialdehyde dehydrogenase
VVLAHLLAPLTDKGLERIAATLVQPASTYGKEAMDELLDQARSILAFAPKHPQAIFGRQLAFNLFPVTPAPVHLGPLVQLTLEVEHPVAVQLLQAPVFHGVGVSLFLRFGVDPGLDAIRQALAAQPLLELPGEGEAPAGMMDSANRDGILVGSLTPELGEPGAYWIWAVMDNLTRGGALNAVAVAEEVLAVD